MGDLKVMAEVYQSNFARIRRAVGRALNDRADQDNVVQQVFVELVESKQLRESYAGGDLGAWLSAIACHKAIDFGRRQSRLVQYDETSAETTRPPSDEPLNEFRSDLLRFAATQGGEAQQLLQLRFIDGLTQTEAANVMKVPRSTLEDWEHQLKEDLRGFLLGSANAKRAK